MLVAQISDLHIGVSVDVNFGGKQIRIDPAATLKNTVTALNNMATRPDAVVASGDLAADGTVDQYRIFHELVADLEIPLFLVPGNHDDRSALRSVFSDHDYLCAEPDSLAYVVDDLSDSIRLICLDTLVVNKHGGHLGERQLKWLDQTLAGSHRPVLLFMHHPPISTGIPVFDKMGCDDGERLGELIESNPQVLAIGCGHVHRSIHAMWHGAMLHVAPSASYQYSLSMSDQAGIVPTIESPACLLYHYRESNGLVVHHCETASLPELKDITGPRN